MRFRSAWSRGLTYGGIFGGVLAAFPVAAAVCGKAPMSEVALGGGVVAGCWGVIGFLAGYCSHGEPSSDDGGQALADRPSLLKRLLYRFVAGLLLSYIAGAVVLGIGFAAYVAWQGNFFASPPRNISANTRDAIFIGFAAMLAAETAAIAGCWLGALLAPGGNVLAPVAKAALVSASFAVLVGTWLAGMLSLVLVQFTLELSTIAMVASVTGAMTGIGMAIVLRLRVLR